MLTRPKPSNGQLPGKQAQVSLEMALVFICVFLLLLGSLKVFFWVNERFVKRQRDFENTRVSAGSSSVEVLVDESAYPDLKIFE